MGHFRLRRNEQFSHHRCACHQHPAYPKTYRCTPAQRRQGTIHAHRNVGPARPSSRGTPCPHHPRLGVTLPHQCSNTVQRGVRCALHKNRVHYHTSRPHDYVWEQMHAYRPVDDTTARRQSADNHNNPTTVHHGHGRQHCCYLLGGRSCALHPPSAMLTHNPNTPERPRTKLRTQNHPRPHSPAYLIPPTTINGNR